MSKLFGRRAASRWPSAGWSGLVAAMLSTGLAAVPALAQNTLSTGRAITPAGTTQPSSGTIVNSGDPGPVIGSLPMNLIVDPSGKYALVSDMGFREYLTAISTATGDIAQPITGHTPLVFPTAANNYHEHPSSDPISPSSITFGEQYTTRNGLYYGLAIAPNGDGTSTIYAAQGNNSSIAVVTLAADGSLTQTGTIVMRRGDDAAGLALDSAGRLYVANNEYYNGGSDPNTAFVPGSMVVYDTKSASVITAVGARPHGPAPEVARVPFNGPMDQFGTISLPSTNHARPAQAQPLTPSNFPFAVAVTPDGSQAFVSSQRDGGVFAITFTGGQPSKTTFIQTGAHPDSLLLSGTTLYVANAHSDSISLVSTGTDAVSATIPLGPTGLQDLPGVTPTGMALSPSGGTLYVTLADMNAVGVVDLNTDTVAGYIPVGWYPSAVAVVPGTNGKDALLVTNAKGTQAVNPNPQGVTELSPPASPYSDAYYDENIIEGDVSRIDLGASTFSLADATQQVLTNNKIAVAQAVADGTAANPLAAVGLQAGKIKHVIYIIKENRTYDQVLGDGYDGSETVNGQTVNGDASLALFGQSVTPNLHNLAHRFVWLDNFYDCSEVSQDGWPWSTQGMATEYVIKNTPYNYSGRGRNYDTEGQNNGLIVGGFPAKDVNGKQLSAFFPNGQAAITDVTASPAGHIWDLAKKYGLTYRNYGFFDSFGVGSLIPDNYPTATNLQPAGHYSGGPLDPAVSGYTDYDFRRFDLNYPDSDGPTTGYKLTSYGQYQEPDRFQEFNRELQAMLAAGKAAGQDDKYVPNLMLLRLMSDHTNGYKLGLATPTEHVADNDYGVAEVVQAVSADPTLWNSTAICVLEDDSQDGPDHVDCHRSTAYVISPYIKQNSVDHTFYNTDSMLRTIEDLLGLPPMTQYDAIASPINDFTADPTQNDAPYTAVLPSATILNQTAAKTLPQNSPLWKLAKLTASMDLTHADAAPESLLNQVIWQSVRGVGSKMPAPRHTVFPARLSALKGKATGKTAARKSDD